MDERYIVPDSDQDIVIGTGEGASRLSQARVYKDQLDDVSAQLAEIVTKSFTDFGAIGDGLTDNTQSFVDLSAWINARGGNCKILFPQGTYNYKPTYTTNYEWRGLVELVDVENVLIEGYGATIKQIKDPSWTANGTPYNQESPFQYRSSGQGTCKNIKIFGLSIQGDRVPYSSITGDGATFGIAFKGVYDVLVQDVKCNGWGTDGLYLGTTYSNTYRGKNAKIVNCEFDNNTRQGVSVSGFDDVLFNNCVFSNTNGGSFGHGLDLEANLPQKQSNIIVTGCLFKGNQRGSLNFIDTNDVVVSNCIMQENAATAALYCDGRVDSIVIDGCKITTIYSALYANGEDIKNFFLVNSTIKTTGLPNNAATIRINSDGTKTGIDNINIKNNEFVGTGGLYTKADGEIYFIGNKMKVSKQSSSNADVFGINCSVGKVYFKENTIAIGSDVVSAPKDVFIQQGEFENNSLLSHSGAIFSIQNKGAGRSVLIGKNKFSPYFYFKGEHTSLDYKGEGTIVRNIAGDFGVTYREVHGGRQRVLNGTEAQVGDVTFAGDNAKPRMSYICTVAGTPGTWLLKEFVIQKSTTAARPSALGAYDQGLIYLDTTLNSNGKPIIWNGSAWIDYTGATV